MIRDALTTLAAAAVLVLGAVIALLTAWPLWLSIAAIAITVRSCS